MKKILLSIIVPIYKSEKYILGLSQTLKVLHKQKNIEFLFVNDESPDKSVEKIKSYFRHFNNITIINKAKGLNTPSGARNVGIEHAKGNWFWFFDHDDKFINSNKLFDLLELLPKIKEDIVHFNYKIKSANGDVRNSSILKSTPSIHFVYSKDNHSKIGIDHPPWSRIYNKKIFINHLWPLIYPCEDLLFNILLLDEGYNVYFYSEYLYQWEPQKTSISSAGPKAMKEYVQLVIKFGHHHKEYELGIFLFLSSRFHLLNNKQKICYKKMYKKYRKSKIYKWYYRAQGFKGHMFLLLSQLRLWKTVSYVLKKIKNY